MNDHRTRAAFRRLETDVRRSVSPRRGLDRLHGVRWWHRALVPAAAFGVVAVAVLGVVLLTGNGEVAPAASTVPLTAPPVTATVPPPATTGPVTTVATDRPVAPFTPVAPGSVITATPNGITVTDGFGTRVLTTALANVAVSDGTGGIVYQDGAFPGPEGSTVRLVRLRPAGGAPEVIATGAGISLYDSAIVDGVPVVFYAVDNAGVAAVGNAPVARFTGSVWLLPLDGGTAKELAEFDTFEGGISRVSYGGGLLAVSVGSEGLSWIHLVDLDGAPVPGSPRPFREDLDEQWVDQAVLAPDGETLVYLHAETPPFGVGGPPVRFITWDVAARIAIGEGAVGLDELDPGRLDFDGRTVTLTRLQMDRTPAAGLIIAAGETEVAAVPGTMSLAGVIVADGAPSGAALIPEEGLAPGYLVADTVGVRWVPEGKSPEDPDAVVLWGFDRDPYMEGTSVVPDGAGGVVVAGDFGPILWLRPGEPRAFVVYEEEGASFDLAGVVTAGDRRILYFLGRYEDGSELRTVDLESGGSTKITGFIEPDLYASSATVGGDRVIVNLLGAQCARIVEVLGDGTVRPLPELPAAPCDGLPEPWRHSARISPDGSLLAYAETVAGPSEFEEMTQLQWTTPVDLVVRDLASGTEVLRREITADPFGWVVVHAFDGERVIVSSEPFEPAAAPQTFQVIDAATGTVTVEFTTVLSTAGLY